MIYFQSLILLCVVYIIWANYINHYNLRDIEGFFDKLLNIKHKLPKESQSFKVEDQIEVEIDNPAFNNSSWAWAVPLDGEFPKRDVFDCIKNKLDREEFKFRLPCPICNTASEDLLWIKFSSPPYTWSKLMGTEGSLSICEKCMIEVDYLQTAMN
jgi:hypothetical protein